MNENGKTYIHHIYYVSVNQGYILLVSFESSCAFLLTLNECQGQKKIKCQPKYQNIDLQDSITNKNGTIKEYPASGFSRVHLVLISFLRLKIERAIARYRVYPGGNLKYFSAER